MSELLQHSGTAVIIKKGQDVHIKNLACAPQNNALAHRKTDWNQSALNKLNIQSVKMCKKPLSNNSEFWGTFCYKWNSQQEKQQVSLIAFFQQCLESLKKFCSRREINLPSHWARNKLNHFCPFLLFPVSQECTCMKKWVCMEKAKPLIVQRILPPVAQPTPHCCYSPLDDFHAR